MPWSPFVFRFFTFTFLFTRVHGFNFVVSPPTECGAQRFTWVGGIPPFSAVILPPHGTLRNISIPADAWNEKDQSGDFSTVLPFAQNSLVVFSMGDATGQTTGGISNVMTVGAPTAGIQSCNTTDPGPQFIFATEGVLAQCKPYPFSLFASSGAVLPISIIVAVPHGESFAVHPPNNNDPFNWQANLTAGTSVLFTMADALNRPGGTSSLTIVQGSDDSSCVHPLPSSPAPTRTPSPTGSAPASNTETSNNHKESSSNTNTGIIIGASVGGTVMLIIIIALVYFFGKRKGKGYVTNPRRIDLTEPGPDSSSYLLPNGHPQAQYPPPTTFPPYRDSVSQFQAGAPPTTTYNNASMTAGASTDAAMGAVMASGIYGTGTVADAASSAQAPQHPTNLQQRETVRPQQYQQDYYNPYGTGGVSSAASDSAYNPTASSRQSVYTDIQLPYTPTFPSNVNFTPGPSSTVTSTQSSSSKQLLLSSGASTQPQRFIMHTDIEDEPMELPPMYSESRGPVPGISPSSVIKSSKGGMQ